MPYYGGVSVKTAYCELYLRLHCVARIIHSIHFHTICLVLRLLCYVYFLKAIRANGGPVTAGIAIAAARGLLLVENKSKLFEYGGHIKLNRSWAYALFNRMGMIQRKPTTSKSKMNITDFAHRKRHFLMTLLQWSKWR